MDQYNYNPTTHLFNGGEHSWKFHSTETVNIFSCASLPLPPPPDIIEAYPPKMLAEVDIYTT